MNQRNNSRLTAIICTAALLTLSAASFAEDECGSAVDAADSMNVNQKECDYSDKGLNGFLQKAFKRGEEGAVLKTSTGEATDQSVNVAANEVAVEGEGNRELKRSDFLSVEVDQWANIPLAKNQLMPKVMARCNKGFRLLDESYRPLPMGRIELIVKYSCL